MAESGVGTSRRSFEKLQSRVQVIRGRAEQTLLWKVWDRMLETEFIDRSIALAGKAFISFFPLIIVVGAFMPSHLRMSIFTTLTHRLGITGASLATVKQAFASAGDIRRATGLLGLVLAIFYALVAWFSGAAICILVGACAGPVLAEDPGPIGRLICGAAPPLVEGALPALPPPVRSLRLADAFSSSDEDTPQQPEPPTTSTPVEPIPAE